MMCFFTGFATLFSCEFVFEFAVVANSIDAVGGLGKEKRRFLRYLHIGPGGCGNKKGRQNPQSLNERNQYTIASSAYVASLWLGV
jgi:hypothetical protein